MAKKATSKRPKQEDTYKGIPTCFYKASETRPVCQTVKELKATLTQLPDDLKLDSDWGSGVELCVAYVNDAGLRLVFRDPEE